MGVGSRPDKSVKPTETSRVANQSAQAYFSKISSMVDSHQ